MEKSPLPTTDAPGLPDGLVVGKANQERRLRLRRGFQVLFLLISCFAVASIGLNTIKDIARPHHRPHFGGEGEGRGAHPWFGGEDEHKGHGPPHPKPIACYPLAPGESVNVTLNLRPGGPPPFHSHGKDHHHHHHRQEDKSIFSLFGKKDDSKHPKHPKHHKGPKGPAPPHIYLHPSLFSSDVALLREGEADKNKLGKAPGGPEGIEVYAIFSREEATETITAEDGETDSKKADICVHRAPNGVSIGAFRPPPPHHGKNGTDSHPPPPPPPPHKGEKGDRPFPPHPKDQYADISAKIHVPAGLGLHLDSLPPPPPPFPRH
ncbi:hypothetical protein BCV69DRAFT_284513 [Microstroma glucosiphilum]|uniref:Uncharacterized protein n=1 Tax=Pseudomicrostroma glucosiphilum TaxID=1684307 RepID=A0A316U108_9BASI|nr:hypothetical protein BCV69DRAFT_284513 [Pseudomicrostroma glucosiphilum]PWN18890.1 hypothetical protein BCV69DRAFT_284513 [Pseudomicrostroma glucosiphilum]